MAPFRLATLSGITKAYRALARGLHRQANRLDRCADQLEGAREPGPVPRGQPAIVHRGRFLVLTPTSFDALDEATAIVRSMNSSGIDWSREPLTVYERSLRTQYLSYALMEERGLHLRALTAAIPYPGTPAADLRQALAVIDARTEAEACERARIQNAIDDLDDAV